MLSLAALLAALALGHGPGSAEAAVCTKTWNGGAGAWGTGANWTPAGVPGGGDNVCISAAGSSVTFTGVATVANLDVTAGDATLTIQGANAGGHATLTVSGVTTNAGTIRLSSINSTWASTLSAASLTNTGSMVTDVGAGGDRTLTGVIATSGTLTVDQPLTLSTATLTNTGAWALNANVGTIGLVTLNQNAGSISGTGELRLEADILNYTSGAVTAPNRLNNSALTTAPGATGGATLYLHGGGATLAGTVSPSTTVVVRGSNTGGHATTTGVGALVNNGAIQLSSEDSTWSATLAVPAGLTNAGTGSLTSAAGAGGARTLSGTVTNSGTITVDQPLTLSSLTLTNTGSFVLNGSVGNAGSVVLNQNAGGITGTGELRLDSDTVNYNSGVVTAPNKLVSTQLTAAPGATGGATLYLHDGSSTLIGTVSAATTVVVRGANAGGHAVTTGVGPVLNNGTIRLTSMDSTWSARLSMPDGLTNNGSLFSDTGNAGSRTLDGVVTSSGTITVDQALTLGAGPAVPLTLTNTGAMVLNADAGNSGPVTMNQNAGSVTGAGLLRLDSDTFNYTSGTVSVPNRLINTALTTSGSAVGSATLYMHGGGATLAGIIAPGTTVVVRGSGTGGHATLTAAATVTNNGVVTLTSEDSSWDANLVVGGAGLDNNGTFNVLAPVGGPRSFTGNLVNDGTVTLGTGTNFGLAGAAYTNNGTFTAAAGTLFVSGVGATFTQQAGTLDVSAGGVTMTNIGFTFNGGTIPGNGLKVKGGSITFGPSASGAATIFAHDAGGTLSGNVGAGTTLNIRGSNDGGHTTWTAAGPMTNAGTIALTSEGSSWGATFNANGGLTNNGTIVSEAGAAGPRTLGGALTNSASGVFTVTQNLSMPTAGSAHSNAGTITIVDGPDSLTVGGLGTTLVNGGTIGGLGTLILSHNAALSGTGSVTNTLLVGSSSVNPGTSPGILTMTSNYVHGASGTALNVELGGPGAGVGYDQLFVTANATLTNGTLSVSTIGGYVPCDGATFDVMQYGSRTGTFTTVNAPAGMTVSYLPNILRLTSTTGAACQPGGKGLDIKGTSSAIELTWDAGNNQVSYSLLRYNTVTAAAELLSLPANAVSHSHTTATNGVLYCYLLAANGPDATTLGLSDLLCGWKGAASGSVQAQNFTLSLNESTNATLTWSAPVGGADSYLLQRIPLDGSSATPVALGGGVTSTVQAVPAAGSCYQLVAFKGAGFGVTNTICGLPGFSTLSGVSLGQVLAAVEQALGPLSHGVLQASKPEGWLD